jgi:two-component system KDP operon response regulator KdpE
MNPDRPPAGDPPVVLIVEDELSIRRFLRPSLQGEGFAVAETGSGAEALALAASRHPAVILLDLGLPDLDGLEVLRRLREAGSVPVIVLTARGRDEDKIAGLDAGADDYLTKPFSVGELLARIRVALRHARKPGEDATAEPYESGDLTVDLAARTVRIGGSEVHLTPHEFGILALLVRRAGKVVTQKQILKEVWGHAGHEQAHYVRLYIHQLRGKIERDPARPRHLVTEPGVGYRLKDA